MAAYVSVMTPALMASSSTTTSTSTSSGGSDDVKTVIWIVAGSIWFMVALIYFMTLITRVMVKKRETPEEREPVVAPRTKFTGRILWAVLKGLLWPLVLLWELVDMIVKEWCTPAGWKWCADVCTCDTCCFKNCWDTHEILAREPGDNRGVAGVGSQTAQTEGVVRDQPSTTGSVEVPPTYQKATKPTELPTYKETTMHTGN